MLEFKLQLPHDNQGSLHLGFLKFVHENQKNCYYS